MPIYVVLYLFVFFLLAFGTTFMHFEQGKRALYVGLEACSYLFLMGFVVDFYSTDININALLVILMIGYCGFWEYWAIIGDMKTAKTHFGISKREVNKLAAITVLFMAPPYFAAFYNIFN